MKTIVLASRKGGSGKTSNTRNLAVALSKQNKRVLLVDTDLQGSLTSWWNRRKSDDIQLLVVPYAQINEAKLKAEAAGFDYLLVDTPPDSNEAIEGTVGIADFVLIPCKASPDDLSAIGQTLRLVRDLDKPFAFILNEAKPNTSLLALALETLSQLGPLAPTQYNHTAHPTAAVSGNTVLDVNINSKPSDDVNKLYGYVVQRIGELA